MNRSPRVFQITSLLLLFVCFAQAAWWVFEEARYTGEVRARSETLYAADAGAGEELRAAGVDPARVEQLFPHLEVTDDGVRIAPAALAELESARRHRLRRYGWEGSFFLLVLLAGMGVIVQALRANTRLLARQQNFLASVSHELKSPIASVKLSAETLLLRRPEPDKVARLANRMVRDSDRLSTLVSNLLDVARLEDGRAEIAPSVQPLRPLVDSTLRELEHDLASIAVEIDVGPDLRVWADAEALRTCLRNLIGNAAKSVASAAHDVGDMSAGRIVIRATASGPGRIDIVVRDDGVGFPHEEKRRIFEKFYRPGDELRRRTKGSGLGLYLVRHLAALHGARVAGTSAGPGRGATFTLKWPSTGSAS
jgi:signal transduction histidine kinase